MKIRAIVATLFISLTVLSASAQNNGQRQSRRQRMDTTELFNRQAERLVKQLKLDDEKKDVFTVLYIDYLNSRHNATHPKGEEDSNERVDFKNLTDEKAAELVQKQFAQTEAQLKIDKEYYPKFLEILTPAQAAQIYLRSARNAFGGMPGGGNRQGFGGNRGGFGGPGGFGGFGEPGGDF